MSEAEAFEAAAAWSSSALQSFTIYISFTFAYLTVAFMVGSRLSRFQSLAGSVLYVFAALSGLMSMITDLGMLEIALKSSPSEVSDVAFASGEFWQLYMVGLMLAGIFISLYFMWDVQRQKPK
jgi:hypothetical protein